MYGRISGASEKPSNSSSLFLPTCNSPLAGYCRSFLRCELGCPRLSTANATLASACDSFRVFSGIRIFQWTAVHLLTDRLLYHNSCDLHKIAPFFHVPMMPRIQG